MSTRIAVAVVLFAVLAVGSCTLTCSTGPEYEERSIATELEAVRSSYGPAALAYLEAAVDTLETYHILGPGYDWEELRLATLEKTQGARTPPGTYDAIRFALQDLGERHGYFLPPNPNGSNAVDERDEHAGKATLSGAEVGLLPSIDLRGKLAHLMVPSLLETSSVAGSIYASRLHALLRQADHEGVCGWIVDVRGNGGGNMWPMLSGLGPLLGSGRIGSFVNRTGISSYWTYGEGRIALDSTVMHKLKEPYELEDPDPPVAVLFDKRTGSAGEAVVVAFRGRKVVRTFGEPSGGASTVPEYFQLSDGAWLVFSIARMADRNGDVFGEVLDPDVATTSPLDAATQWLLKLDACTNMPNSRTGLYNQQLHQTVRFASGW